jgi:ubiquinone biosynthesis monooxygenase Coq7
MECAGGIPDLHRYLPCAYKEKTMTLPGDLSQQERIKRMIRVDHAGEYGAKRIYAGQLAVLGKSPSAAVIEEMAHQEQAHLDTFSELMVKHRVRPTVLMPLWHVAGYALGALTAMLGEKAAMACTVAVESVIDEHYAAQEKQLDDKQTELKTVIGQFRADEKKHHDTALAHEAESAPLYPLLTALIVYQTKLAIWLSTRI